MIFYIIKILLVYALLCLPVQKNLQHLARLRNCSRSQSSVVRQLLHKLWKPIFRRFQARLPQSCPLHASRDVFAEQELSKVYYRSNLWLCGLCGKAFQDSLSLDMHVARRHADVFLHDDSAVCPADHCDSFRCRLYLPNNNTAITNHDLLSLNSSSTAPHFPDLLGPPLAAPPGSTQLAQAPPKELLDLLSFQDKLLLESSSTPPHHQDRRLPGRNSRSRDPLDSSRDSREESRPRSTTTTTTPEKEKVQQPHHPLPFTFFRRLDHTKKREAKKKARVLLEEEEEEEFENSFSGKEEEEVAAACSPTKMREMARKCEDLVDECVDPLLPHMDDADFVALRGGLSKSTCFYLHCDRLFDSLSLKMKSPSEKAGKSGEKYFFRIFSGLFLALSIFLVVTCYLVWVCF